MNQILKPEINHNNQIKKQENSHRKLNFFKIQFLLSAIIATFFLVFYFIRMYKIDRNEKLSKQLMSQYQVSTLYSNNIVYSAQLVDSSTDTILANSTTNSSTPFVIGMIKIDKIGLTYPILSETSKELLDVSVCRFAGPMPNQVGNLCIAGHNYVDYKFFSRLNELSKNDIIKIFDLNGSMVEYIITDMYEVNANDLSCTDQDTNGNIMITLLTCNNVSGNRLIISAKSK